MKVLAIRGSNLTSFAGDFALELDQPPLDRLGLFAITGATGAGKSTLLDALCLALFDRTPRLGGRGGAPVGRADEDEDARLSAYDVRGMLRRGAGEGYAEVDFLGKDGRRYRARWSVWRARNRAEGRFRPQEMQLMDVVTGQLTGRTKGEVLAAIQERLGLSFDQFRRSALLAQGEFAAFLKADASERAELLERMTGTEVYSRLSMAAHEKNKAEQESLAKRAQGLAAIALMPEAERAAAAAALGEEARARQTVEALLKDAEGAAAWHVARAGLREAEQAAEAKAQAARTALEEAAPRAARMEEVREAETFRGPVAAVEAAERRWAEAEAAQVARASEVEAVLAETSARRVGQLEAEAARAAAQEREVATRPALEEAARLDARLEGVSHEAREARARAEKSQAALVEAKGELDAVLAREAEARDKGEAARHWLTEKAHWVALTSEWPRWQRELERYEGAQGERRKAREESGRLLGEVEGLRETVGLRREERDAAVRAEEMALAAATHAEAAVGTETGAQRRAQRERLLARQEAVRGLKTAHEGLVADEAEAREAGTEVKAAKAEVEAATAEARAAETRRTQGEAALKEAQRSLSLAQATQGYASHRTLLKDGEACPLCGAEEHPYAREVSALDGLVAEAASRVEALEEERTAATQAEVAASARRAAANARAGQAETRRQSAEARAEAHGEAWRKGCASWLASIREEGAEPGASLPPAVGGSPEAGAWLDAVRAELAERLAALKADEQAAESLARTAREARAALETQRTRREVAAESLRRAEEALSRAESVLKDVHARLEAAEQTLRQVLAEVSPVFTADVGWERKLEEDPATFRRKCGERVVMWKGKEEARLKAEEREAEEQRHRARAQGLVEVSTRHAEEHQAFAVRKEQERGELTRARAALLHGRPTAEVRAELQARLEATESAFEQARERAEAAHQSAQVATARAEDAVRARAEALALRESEGAALTALLATRGTTLDAVRMLLSFDAAWREAEARALSALREALAQATAVLAERSERRTRHEDSGPPSLSEQDAGAECERLRAEVEARRHAEATLHARLEADDTARARHGTEAAALEEGRRAAEVWKVLGDLIGSHDGKRFKVFAQSLTLDALLLHANAHLRELARRYRLMRVPGHDLDLQIVDGDMGDEVRSVASLSGGESFLVSLALALGLASLSSETTQVETLFIDEGFGTLDPETLEVALATLDALQATGRQVGIISHVSGMAERIGVQVRVVKQGGGRSRLVVEGDPGMVPPSMGQQEVA
ncbi:nuclease SbcCD subunit C [Myxococcus xanthus]|uniref:Nuclease SbcCD subunit C n=1 Tax=Myxococcus xanthus TaxID=34 RepID=A0AAE6FW51_MYXXA|nr:AAA family ATPase [Myxococcus xanthus]QDE66401.1 nuclease SbcCD subunit C [Myxococcus xanthus]QDE73674.1 nuclease SbcCD subunit C [Myxococcus xanthus]